MHEDKVKSPQPIKWPAGVPPSVRAAAEAEIDRYMREWEAALRRRLDEQRKTD